MSLGGYVQAGAAGHGQGGGRSSGGSEELPSGVPYPLIHICSNRRILIAESGCSVVKLHDHLGNAG